MAIASSQFLPKSMLDRFRSPVFLASALSVGAHGIFFAAMPMLSASEDLQDQEESVPVVALSVEESQRLPGAVKNSRSNSRSSSFFGDAPLTTQEGDALLPVPGLPPYGDLSGLNSNFSEPLQTAPPLWGNPVDIFQGSLPAIPAETNLIFPETNTFDRFNSKPFELELDTDNKKTVEVDESLKVEKETFEAEPEPEAIANEDQPLIGNNGDEPLGSGLKAPLTAPAGGTTIGSAFGKPELELEPETPENDPQPAVNPNDLAAALPAEAEAPPVPEKEAESNEPPALASNNPALLALQAEQERLRVGYRKNSGEGGSDGKAASSNLGDFANNNNLELTLPLPSESLSIQYPDPWHDCPADAIPATFAVAKQADGTALVSEKLQSSQYLALDLAAQEAATTYAENLEAPGPYLLNIQFEDPAGQCGASFPSNPVS